LRVAKDAAMPEGSLASFGLNPQRLHLFDRASGLSLRAGR